MRLTPREHLEVRNQHEATAMGTAWSGQPLGVLLVEDDKGRKYSVVTTDIEYHRMFVSGAATLHEGIEIPPGTYPMRRAGWPGEPGWLAGNRASRRGKRR